MFWEDGYTYERFERDQEEYGRRQEKYELEDEMSDREWDEMEDDLEWL